MVVILKSSYLIVAGFACRRAHRLREAQDEALVREADGLNLHRRFAGPHDALEPFVSFRGHPTADGLANVQRSIGTECVVHATKPQALTAEERKRGALVHAGNFFEI